MTELILEKKTMSPCHGNTLQINKIQFYSVNLSFKNFKNFVSNKPKFITPKLLLYPRSGFSTFFTESPILQRRSNDVTFFKRNSPISDKLSLSLRHQNVSRPTVDFMFNLNALKTNTEIILI